MTCTTSLEDRISGALFGMFIGDALAMPVHWYYDTTALRRGVSRLNVAELMKNILVDIA